MVKWFNNKLINVLDNLLDKYEGKKKEYNSNYKYIFIIQNFVLLYLKFIKVYYGIIYIRAFYYIKVTAKFCIVLYVFIYLCLYKFIYIIVVIIIYNVILIMNIYYYVSQGYTFNTALREIVLVREEKVEELNNMVRIMLKHVGK